MQVDWLVIDVDLIRWTDYVYPTPHDLLRLQPVAHGCAGYTVTVQPTVGYYRLPRGVGLRAGFAGYPIYWRCNAVVTCPTFPAITPLHLLRLRWYLIPVVTPRSRYVITYVVLRYGPDSS